jgi:hypothetical protein
VVRGRSEVAPDNVALSALQQDLLRTDAVIKAQERLEIARRLQDLEDLREELEDNDDIDTAVKSQRQQQRRAAKERFVAAEGAHQKKLQDLRNAARTRMMQPHPSCVPRGPSCKQELKQAWPSRLSHIEFQELHFHISAPRLGAPGALGGGAYIKKEGDSFVNGVPSDFLRENRLCINFNKGKCQDVGTHRHPFLATKILVHQCGACKKAGKTDTSHGSHELDKCPNKQPFRRQ